MGVATDVETKINEILGSFVSDKVEVLCNLLEPIAITGVAIYIMIMGYAIMRGEAQDSLHTFLWKSLKIAVISGIALSAGDFQAIVVEGMEGIQTDFISALSDTKAKTIGNLIDDLAEPYIRVWDAGWKLIDEAGIGSIGKALFGLLILLIVVLAQAILFVVSLAMYMIAKVSLALVFAVGPAFIFAAMFPATQRFAESWIGQALSFVFLNVLIAACLSMLPAIVHQVASDIGADASTMEILKGTVSLLIVSCALAYVLLNLDPIAGALSGGASLTGAAAQKIGGKMAGKYMGWAKAGAKGTVKGAWRGATAAYNKLRSNSVSGEGGSSTPQYQSNVIDNIRRAA